MMAPAQKALQLQRPLPDNELVIVASGERKDEAASPLFGGAEKEPSCTISAGSPSKI